MMTNDVAHKSRWQIFEVIFGIPFLAALILQWFAPIAFPRQIPVPARIPSGVVLIVAGVILVTLARREFVRYRQPTDPGLPTSQIIVTGVFSFSRNPLYLGGVLFLTGISVALDLPWILILLTPALIACQYILILPEEKYLATRFGEPYRTYTKRVHRWIGRKS